MSFSLICLFIEGVALQGLQPSRRHLSSDSLPDTEPRSHISHTSVEW